MYSLCSVSDIVKFRAFSAFGLPHAAPLSYIPHTLHHVDRSKRCMIPTGTCQHPAPRGRLACSTSRPQRPAPLRTAPVGSTLCEHSGGAGLQPAVSRRRARSERGYLLLLHCHCVHVVPAPVQVAVSKALCAAGRPVLLPGPSHERALHEPLLERPRQAVPAPGRARQSTHTSSSAVQPASAPRRAHCRARGPILCKAWVWEAPSICMQHSYDRRHKRRQVGCACTACLMRCACEMRTEASAGGWVGCRLQAHWHALIGQTATAQAQQFQLALSMVAVTVRCK